MVLKTSLLSIGVAMALTFSGAASAQSADVVHWLTSGGESKAIGVLAAEYKKRGGTWIDNAMVGSEAARSVATSRIAGGNPPTAMFWPLGGRMSGLTEQDLLVNLDDLAKAGNWNANLPKLVNQKKQHNGHVIAAPVGIHGLNWMFYSTAIVGNCCKYARSAQ
jgi:glucose/mannose transport system substrate-binding protein